MRRRNWCGESGWLGAACCLLLATGCCSFEREWRDAATRCDPADGLAGRWEGTWESEVNGHAGRLRAIVTPCGSGRYDVHYHATFAGCVPFAYRVPMNATEQGGPWVFQGEADLGCLAGGEYTYSGRADGCEYRAAYRAAKDHGVFAMRRVGGIGGACCRQGCAG